MIPEGEISADDAKELIGEISYLGHVEESRNWFGSLNQSNIHIVADKIRKILVGRVFAITTVHYADSGHPDVRLQTDCFLNSKWKDGKADEIRVFTNPNHNYIGFSCGGYYWSIDAAPGSEQHDDYRYGYLSFEGDSMKLTNRSPSKDLHIHIFMVQKDCDLAEIRG